MVPCTAGVINSASGSCGSSSVQGEATWKTPEQPFMAAEIASASRRSASKILRREEEAPGRAKRWEASEPGKMEAWMVG